MKVPVDMNLSPAWCAVLAGAGQVATHWSQVGSPTDDNSQLAAWARQNEYVILTCDLDFGALLAMTQADGPSVLLLRGGEVRPSRVAPAVLICLSQFADELESGALVVLDRSRTRVRVLPLR